MILWPLRMLLFQVIISHLWIASTLPPLNRQDRSKTSSKDEYGWWIWSLRFLSNRKKKWVSSLRRIRVHLSTIMTISSTCLRWVKIRETRLLTIKISLPIKNIKREMQNSPLVLSLISRNLFSNNLNKTRLMVDSEEDPLLTNLNQNHHLNS
jgi:hypothetical protein